MQLSTLMRWTWRIPPSSPEHQDILTRKITSQPSHKCEELLNSLYPGANEAHIISDLYDSDHDCDDMHKDDAIEDVYMRSCSLDIHVENNSEIQLSMYGLPSSLQRVSLQEHSHCHQSRKARPRQLRLVEGRLQVVGFNADSEYESKSATRKSKYCPYNSKNFWNEVGHFLMQ